MVALDLRVPSDTMFHWIHVIIRLYPTAPVDQMASLGPMVPLYLFDAFLANGCIDQMVPMDPLDVVDLLKIKGTTVNGKFRGIAKWDYT